MTKDRKTRIVEAGNVQKYASNIIRRKGYKIFYVPDGTDEYTGNFWAIKDRRDFIADEPLKLLGLIHIWEEFGDKWYTKPKYPLESYDTIYKYSTLEFESVADLKKLSQEAFQDLVQSFQILFEALYIDLHIPENISPEKLFDCMDKYHEISFEKVYLSMDWQDLNTTERVLYFRKFLKKVFAMSESYFDAKLLYFEHDYAAIDDEYQVWWIDTRIEWKNQTYEFRISYDYAYSEQMQIPKLIEDLNKILKESQYCYDYLESEHKYLIYFRKKD